MQLSLITQTRRSSSSSLYTGPALIQSCIHGAGVLDDGVIYRQARQRIILVWMQMITWSLNMMMMMMFIG